jgi:hypothetical protein
VKADEVTPEVFYWLDLRTIAGYEIDKILSRLPFPYVGVREQLDLEYKTPGIYYVWHRVVKIEKLTASMLHFHTVLWIADRPPTDKDLAAYDVSRLIRQDAET